MAGRFSGAKQAIALVGNTSLIASVSVTFFIIAICLGARRSRKLPCRHQGHGQNTFPKIGPFPQASLLWRDRRGWLPPVTIPFIAKAWGWESAFLLIGALGFLWMGFWVLVYKKPETNPHVNAAELNYIHQDNDHDTVCSGQMTADKKVTFAACFKHRQTWAFAIGKFMTDGVWWFFLFWTPAYLSSVYKMDSTQSAFPIFVLYMITLLSIIGGWLPSYFVDKEGMNPYAGRMRAMLIFAFFPLLALLAQPLGRISYWLPVLIIGIAAAAHQAWSANIFSTVGDMFPRKAIAALQASEAWPVV